jgi:hypothetical protein
VTTQTLQKIKDNYASILSFQRGGGIEFFTSTKDTRVFTVDTAPGLVFKTSSDPEEIAKRYANTLQAELVCKIHNLSCVVIPKTALLAIEHDGKVTRLLVQQRLEVDEDINGRIRRFKSDDEELDDAIEDFAIFLHFFKYIDLHPRNNPIIGNKIAVIDFENRGVSEERILGYSYGLKVSTALVDFVGKRHAKIAGQVANRFGVLGDYDEFTEEEVDIERQNRGCPVFSRLMSLF